MTFVFLNFFSKMVFLTKKKRLTEKLTVLTQEETSEGNIFHVVPIACVCRASQSV